MLQAVFGDVALKPDRLGSDQLHVVHVLLGQAEDALDPFDVFPVLLHIKGPHIGEDHAIVIRLGEILEDHLPQPLDGAAPELVENFENRFDHHVIVEQPQFGNFR